MSAPLLAAVLAYCADHPHFVKEQYGDLVMRHDAATGHVEVVGEAPGIIAISVALLDVADADRLSWQDDFLVIDTYPEQLRYRPLYLDRLHHIVVCRRADTVVG